MGLLDEAIREHLELKRRRGADAVDLSRQESEALGPVRRSPDGAPDLPDTFDAARARRRRRAAARRPAGRATATRPAARLARAPYEPPSRRLRAAAAEVTGYEPPAAAGLRAAPGRRTERAPPAPRRIPTRAAGRRRPSRPGAPTPPSPSPTRRGRRTRAARAAARTSSPLPPTSRLRSPGRWRPIPCPSPARRPSPPSRFSRLRLGRRSTKPDPAPARALRAGRADDDVPGRGAAAAALELRAAEHPGRLRAALPLRAARRRRPPRLRPAAGPPTSPTSCPPTTRREAEDVLEETPDFLEETPEHDRLWFEQRPPRDFDFDD